MSVPAIPTLLWHHWQPVWSLDALAILVSLLYVIGARRVRQRWPRARTAAFQAGVACVLVALQSGWAAFDDRLLSDHMVQHLLLLELAPLLLLAGRPGTLLLRSLPRGNRRPLARALVRLRPVTHPIVCLSVFYAVVALTHLPLFYDATLRNSGLHESEHSLYLLAGAFMWWPILDGDPVPGRRLDGIGRLIYVIAAMLPMTLLGAYLDRAPALLYSAYAAPAHALGISALVDQQQAGAIMWVLGSTLMVLAGLWQAMAALVAEERRLQIREGRLPEPVLADRWREP
ncbi:MAG TPA: cytochrome c oxidase assembly protein [Solirubrobacteraceae bacterium]